MPWPKGRQFTHEHRRKLVVAHRGQKHAAATRQRQRIAHLTSPLVAARFAMKRLRRCA